MRSARTFRYLILTILLSVSAASAFDHEYTEYAGLLQKFVSNGRVDYAALAQDRQPLDRFLSECSQVSFEEYKTFSRARQICFMVNLYNASAIALVLGSYPLQSIQDMEGMFTSPWNRRTVSLFEHKVGLGHIQHDIIRPEFKEPRLHFVLSITALGGPDLSNKPYLPDKLEQQLIEAERKFMTERPQENYFADGTMHLSELFKWYPDDFGGQPGILQLVQRYFPNAKPESNVVFTDFDWSLNSK